MEKSHRAGLPQLISKEQVVALEVGQFCKAGCLVGHDLRGRLAPPPIGSSCLGQANTSQLCCIFVIPQAELDQGASIAALRRFNTALQNLPADRWGE